LAINICVQIAGATVILIPTFSIRQPNSYLVGTEISGNSPFTVQFYVTTNGPQNCYGWDFGDGKQFFGDATAPEIGAPTHTYYNTGGFAPWPDVYHPVLYLGVLRPGGSSSLCNRNDMMISNYIDTYQSTPGKVVVYAPPKSTPTPTYTPYGTYTPIPTDTHGIPIVPTIMPTPTGTHIYPTITALPTIPTIPTLQTLPIPTPICPLPTPTPAPITPKQTKISIVKNTISTVPTTIKVNLTQASVIDSDAPTSSTIMPTTIVPPPSTLPTRSAHEWDEIGLERYNNTDYSGAIKAFNAALVIDPNDRKAQIGKQFAQEELSGTAPKEAALPFGVFELCAFFIIIITVKRTNRSEKK
jgi:hypothetical protein